VLKRGILLLLLASMLASQALGEVTVVPASQDVYISMGGDRVSVYNQTDYLLCAIDLTEENGTQEESYPGVPVIQFDISDVNITDEDVAVLVLKAEAMQISEDPVLVALLTVGSDWNEDSDYTEYLVNILPAWKAIKNSDATVMSSNTDGDLIFSFDVSKKLQDASKDGKISFLLMAASNSTTEITFLSRESEYGPALLIMPYPATAQSMAESSSQMTPALQENQTAQAAINGQAAETIQEDLNASADINSSQEPQELQNATVSPLLVLLD